MYWVRSVIKGPKDAQVIKLRRAQLRPKAADLLKKKKQAKQLKRRNDKSKQTALNSTSLKAAPWKSPLSFDRLFILFSTSSIFV